MSFSAVSGLGKAIAVTAVAGAVLFVGDAANAAPAAVGGTSVQTASIGSATPPAVTVNPDGSLTVVAATTDVAPQLVGYTFSQGSTSRAAS